MDDTYVIVEFIGIEVWPLAPVVIAVVVSMVVGMLGLVVILASRRRVE